MQLCVYLSLAASKLVGYCSYQTAVERFMNKLIPHSMKMTRAINIFCYN